MQEITLTINDKFTISKHDDGTGWYSYHVIDVEDGENEGLRLWFSPSAWALLQMQVYDFPHFICGKIHKPQCRTSTNLSMEA